MLRAMCDASLISLKGLNRNWCQSRWQDWDFLQLVNVLKLWKDINPIESSNDSKRNSCGHHAIFKHTIILSNPGGCVYCQSETHKLIYCERLKTVDGCKKYLTKNRLCFNCTHSQHRAADYKSRSACHKCQRKHHRSICDQTNNPLLAASCNENRSVCYPVVVVEINGVKCHALLDTGAGSSYASNVLNNQLKIKPVKVEQRRIEMMIGSVTKNIELYKIRVKSLK